MRGRRASPSRARRAATSSRRAPASARPPPSPAPHRYRPKAAKKTYANQLPTHTKGQASQLVKQVRRHQRRNTPPDAGSYFRRRRRRVFDWINNVAKWTSDGPEEREDGSQRVLRHYRRNHLSLNNCLRAALRYDFMMHPGAAMPVVARKMSLTFHSARQEHLSWQKQPET